MHVISGGMSAVFYPAGSFFGYFLWGESNEKESNEKESKRQSTFICSPGLITYCLPAWANQIVKLVGL